MAVKFQFWESDSDTWQTMFHRAKDRADQVGPQRLISISHSSNASKGVVAVWYWAKGDYEGEPPRMPSKVARRSSFHLIESMDSWNEIFSQAANLATQIGSARLIGISHACDGAVLNTGTVAVWYWLDEDEDD